MTIRFGDTQEIALTMDENLVELYEIEARGGTLVIDAYDAKDKKMIWRGTGREEERLPMVYSHGPTGAFLADQPPQQDFKQSPGNLQASHQALRYSLRIRNGGEKLCPIALKSCASKTLTRGST